MLTYAEVEAFLAIHKNKNITQAAESLYISQSSLSTRLKSLEEKLGYSLFIRHKGKKTLELTETGKKFYPLALDYFDVINKMHSLGNISQQEVLNINMISSLASYMFTPVIQLYLNQHTESSINVQDIRAQYVAPSLLDSKVDFSFTTDPCVHESLLSSPLISEQMQIISSSKCNMPLNIGKGDLDFSNEIYIEWCKPFHHWHKNFTGKDSDTKIKLSTIEQLIPFFKNQPCWAVVPYSVAKSLSEQLDIKLHSCSFDLPVRTIYCTYRYEYNSPAMLQFLSIVKDYIEKNFENKVKYIA